jgi:hypothetical protein
MDYDFEDAWNVANHRKRRSNLARCYIEVVTMARRGHKPDCICVLCEKFTRELKATQSDAAT